MNCASLSRYEDDCHRLAERAKIPKYDKPKPLQDVKRILQRWLESEASGDWTLVLDNADKKSDFFSGSGGGLRNAKIVRIHAKNSKGNHYYYNKRYRSCSTISWSEKRIAHQKDGIRPCRSIT
jgi:hypothetical protein